MLSDRDRATLDELRRQLLTDDPQFVRSFNTRALRLPGVSCNPTDRRARVLLTLIWITGALGVLLLIVGAVGVGLLLAGVAVAMAVALGCQHSEARPPSS